MAATTCNPPPRTECTEVAQAAAWLHTRYGNSRMTGSGSAVFARVGTGNQPMATLSGGGTSAGLGGPHVPQSGSRTPIAGLGRG